MKRSLLLGLVYLYRLFSRPFFIFSHMFGLPVMCKYPVSCSEYAVLQLQSNESVVNALRCIVLRLLSCHPLARGGR